MEITKKGAGKRTEGFANEVRGRIRERGKLLTKRMERKKPGQLKTRPHPAGGRAFFCRKSKRGAGARPPARPVPT